MTSSKVTDYAGNKIYEDGILKRILTDNGYIEGNTYYFYIKDHLGNNRIVANASGSVVQSTQYYPFGMAFAESTNQGTQPYKYNGKELDLDHGLNWYDYEARYLTNDVPRFTTMDPLAEKFYNYSPYVYCYNNPMKFVDKDGKQGVLPVPGGAIPIPMVPMAVSANQSTTNQLAEQGRTIKNTVSEAVNLIQSATIIAGTKLLMDIGVLEASSNPGYANQRKNDRVAKEGLDAAQAAVAKGIEDNITGDMPSGDPAPKRNPKGNIGKIVLSMGTGEASIKETVEYILDTVNKDSNKKIENKVKQNPPQKDTNNSLQMVDWDKVFNPIIFSK